MTIKSFYDLVRVYTSTTGTGTLTVGSAVSGFLAFSGNGQGGVPDGALVSYGIQDGSSRETGTGVYTLSTNALTRNVMRSTSFNSVSQSYNPISLSGSAQVFITALATDMNALEAAADVVPQIAYQYIKMNTGGVWGYSLSTLTYTDVFGTSHTPTAIKVDGSDISLTWTPSLTGGYKDVIAYFSTPIIPAALGITVVTNTGMAPSAISASNDQSNWVSLGSVQVANNSSAQTLPLTYPVTNYAANFADCLDVYIGAAPTDGQTINWNNTRKQWVLGTNIANLTDLSDWKGTTPTDGQVVTWSSSKGGWDAETPSSGGGGGGGGGSSTQAHTYWRISNVTTQSERGVYDLASWNELIAISQLEFRATAGGAAQTPTAATGSPLGSGRDRKSVV